MQFLDPNDPDLQDVDDEDDGGNDRQRQPVPRGPWDVSDAAAGEVSDLQVPRRYGGRWCGGGAFALGLLGPLFCGSAVCMRTRAVAACSCRACIHIIHAHI